MTAQHFRFSGSARALWNEISTGVLGNIYHARCWMLRRAWAPLQQGFICKKNSGGGPCIDIGVHILDLALWFMGHPKPVRVSGTSPTALAHVPEAFSLWGGAIPKEFDVEDFAAGFVRFENGATLIIEVSWLLHHKTPGEDTQIWLYGNKAGAHWPTNEIVTSNNNTRQLINSQLQIADSSIEPHALECMEFASAIVEGRPCPVPAEQSLTAMTILDGLYHSARSGQEMVLD